MSAKSVGAVNAALAARKIKAELVKGHRYFYFTGEDAEDMECTSVMVPAVRDLTVKQWVNEFLSLKGLPNAV